MLLRTCILAISGIMMFCAGQAQALMIKKMAKGYVMMLKTPTGKHCWGILQNQDLPHFPDKPMDLEAAAQKFHWPEPSKDQKSACEAIEKISWVDSNDKIKKTAKGYVIMLKTPTGKHCWGIPQHLDLSYFPEKPMDVEVAAQNFHWPKPTKDQKSVCEAMKKISWKVSSNQQQTVQPVYKIVDGKNKLHNKVTETVIDKINANTVCGAYVNNYGISADQTWRLVTGISGKQGAALCKEHK